MLLRKDNSVHSEPRTGKGQPESKGKASKEKTDRHTAFTEKLSIIWMLSFTFLRNPEEG